MPTVPWIRLYQNWPRHKKTMALRRALGTAEPVLCLWLWAAENAPDGDLDGMTTEEIEEASGWQGRRGKAIMAMVEAGFIDVIPEAGMRLHNWSERAGKGVASLLKGRERMRGFMKERRSGGDVSGATRQFVFARDNWQCRYCGSSERLEIDHVVPVSKGGSHDAANLVAACRKCNRKKRNDIANLNDYVNVNIDANKHGNKSETLSLSLDLGTSGSSSLSASDPDQTRDPGTTGPKPKTSYDWLCYFKVKYWETRGRDYGQGTADAKAMANFGDLLDSLPPEQRAEDWLARERIVTEFLNRTDHRTVGSGWPFSFFVTDFRGLAMPPEKRPVAPSHGPRQAVYPVLKKAAT